MTTPNPELVELFLLSPTALAYVYDQIRVKYVQNPADFADQFFELVDQINPKSVRLIAYQLMSQNIDMAQLYAQRSQTDLPSFLYDLSSFPNETMMVLLKYQFPPYLEGNHYLWWSLDQFATSSQALSRQINRLGWLDFNLDLSLHLGIDLDHINQDGLTLLQKAVQQGLLSVAMKLLMHRANPLINLVESTKLERSTLSLALDLFDLAGNEVTLPVNLMMVRQLIRYRALVEPEDQARINSSQFRENLESALDTGRKLIPIYESIEPRYLELDPIEDLALLAKIDPTIVSAESFQQTLPESSSEPFLKSIRIQQDQSIIATPSNTSSVEVETEAEPILVTWPKYINMTGEPPLTCNLQREERLSVESPFPPEQVYALALRGLPDTGASQPTFTLSRPTITRGAPRVLKLPETKATQGFEPGYPPLVFDDPQPSIESIRRWPGPIEAIFEAYNPSLSPTGFVTLTGTNDLPFGSAQGSTSYLPGTPDGPSTSAVRATIPLATGPLRPTLTPSLPTLPLPSLLPESAPVVVV